MVKLLLTSNLSHIYGPKLEKNLYGLFAPSLLLIFRLFFAAEKDFKPVQPLEIKDSGTLFFNWA